MRNSTYMFHEINHINETSRLRPVDRMASCNQLSMSYAITSLACAWKKKCSMVALCWVLMLLLFAYASAQESTAAQAPAVNEPADFSEENAQPNLYADGIHEESPKSGNEPYGRSNLLENISRFISHPVQLKHCIAIIFILACLLIFTFWGVIPVWLWFLDRRDNNHRLRDYTNSLLSFTYSAVALLFGILIPVAILIEIINSPHRFLLESSTEQNFISLAKLILAFVGILLAAASASIGVILYLLRSRLDKTDKTVNEGLEDAKKTAEDTRKTVEDEKAEIDKAIKQIPQEVEAKTSNAINKTSNAIKKLEDEAETLENIDRKLARNVILTADIALMNLPDISFTQQIPLSMLKALQILNGTFEDTPGSSEGHRLWKLLRDSEHGAKILYARALYLIGTRGYVPSGQDDVDSSINPISLLEEARNLSEESDPLLYRQILIRLCQAHRQAGAFARAEKNIEELRKAGLQDPYARILSRWGEAVNELQKGLRIMPKSHGDDRGKAEKLRQDRLDCFMNARRIMKGVSKEVFGWRIGKGKGRPEYYHLVRSASLAYYTAKATWAVRMCLPRIKTEYEREAKASGISSDELNDELYEFLNWAARLLCESLDEVIGDPLIATIYNYCLASVLIVIRCAKVRDGFPSKREWFEEEIRTSTYWNERLHNCLSSVEASVNFLKTMSMKCPLTAKIYCEGTERIDSLDMFQEDVKLLQETVKKPTVLFEFYRLGKSPSDVI